MQYLVIAVVFFSVSSYCCGDCGNEPDTLEVDRIKLTFSADDNDEKSITVSSNTSWNFSRSESWIEARLSDNKLYVKVENYTNTSSPRTGTITLTAGDALPKTITVEQAAKEINTLSVNPTSLEFSAYETVAKTVSVTTDSKEGWNATTASSWITLSKKGNTLEVKVGVNTSALERVGNIIVTSGNAPEITITVKQAAEIILTVSPTSLSFNYNNPADQYITVITNASDWSATTSVSWLTLSKIGQTLRVKATTNSNTARSTTITITADNGKATKTVSVSQAASPIPGPVLPYTIYNASGIPKMLQTPGPSTWSGIFSHEGGQRYSITGWGGMTITVYLNYDSSTKKFTIEYQTPVLTDSSNSQIKGYFVAFTVSDYKLTIIKDYSFSFDSSTRTIDFSGKYNGIDVLVGILAVTGTIDNINNIVGAFTECYANVKIVLENNLNAPQIYNDTEKKSLKLSDEKLIINSKSIKKVEVKSINDL